MAVDWPEKALMKPDFDLRRLQDIFKSWCHPDAADICMSANTQLSTKVQHSPEHQSPDQAKARRRL